MKIKIMNSAKQKRIRMGDRRLSHAGRTTLAVLTGLLLPLTMVVPAQAYDPEEEWLIDVKVKDLIINTDSEYFNSNDAPCYPFDVQGTYTVPTLYRDGYNNIQVSGPDDLEIQILYDVYGPAWINDARARWTRFDWAILASHPDKMNVLTPGFSLTDVGEDSDDQGKTWWCDDVNSFGQHAIAVQEDSDPNLEYLENHEVRSFWTYVPTEFTESTLFHFPRPFIPFNVKSGTRISSFKASKSGSKRTFTAYIDYVELDDYDKGPHWAGFGGAKVSLQRLSGKTWKTVANSYASWNGLVKMSYKSSKTGTYRLYYAGNSGHEAKSSNAIKK